MTPEQILTTMAMGFWFVLGKVFLVLCGLFILYSIILAIYTLIIKR
jgi:hypothetical protein